MQQSTLDLRPALLKKMLPFMLGIVIVALLAVQLPLSYHNPDTTAYTILLGSLLGMLLVSMQALRKDHYLVSASLTVAVAFLGTWGSFLINSQSLLCDFFPLVYVSGSIIIASIFMPQTLTLVFIAANGLLLVLVVLKTPLLQTQNWPSFFIFILFVALISTIASSLIRSQVQQLQDLSIRDHLTGLFNRRYFEETLESKLRREHHGDSSVGIILLDIDHFKKFNDTYGHDAGDAVLIELANLMLRHFDISINVCRYGGDEFAILLPKVLREELSMLTESLVEKVRNHALRYNNKQLGNMTISCGYALYSYTAETLDEFIKHADQALYQAKEHGRDQAIGH